MTQEKYSGEFPDFVIHSRNYLQQVAKELAWAKGTSTSKYAYKGGRATSNFKTALSKVYPNRSSWGAKAKAGASCDVFVGTVLRYSGCDTTWARGLDGQYGKTPKHMSMTTNIKECQMLIYEGHTRMVVDIGGTKYNCEANHNKNGGQYGHIGGKASKPAKKKLKMFKVTSAFKKTIEQGDEGSEVTKLQKFLNWAGFSVGTIDGDFGIKTTSAVKLFQTNVGLTADGKFGSQSLAKAKEFTKEVALVKKPYSGTFPKLPARRYFKRGDKGMQVKYLQKFLNWYGKYGLAVDGVIGSKTIVAVEKFQKSEKLDVDGLFGKKCLAKAKQAER